MVISNTYSVVNGVGIIPEGTTKLIKPSDEHTIRELRRIRIPGTLTDIDFNSLCFARNLEEIIVDEDNPVYDSRGGCNALIDTSENNIILGCKNTVIPETVESIGRWAFSETEISKIHIPSSVTVIECGAFFKCRHLKTITLSEGLEFIAAWAFQGCPIKEIKLPESLIELSNEVFIGCDKLECLYIPKNVEAIDIYLASGCSNLCEIKVDPENTHYDSRNRCNAIIETATNTLIVGCASTFIPDGVEIIAQGAFTNLETLEDIEIPESVIEIKDYAFRNNDNLRNVGIYAPLKHLSESAFYNCKGIENLYLSSGIKKISATFEGSNLRKISVPFGKVKYYKRRFPENLHEIIVESYSLENVPYDICEGVIAIGPITPEKREQLKKLRESCRRRFRQFDVEIVTPEECQERYGNLPPEGQFIL